MRVREDVKVQSMKSPKWGNRKQDVNSYQSLSGDEGGGRVKSRLEILETGLELLGSNTYNHPANTVVGYYPSMNEGRKLE